MIAYYAKFVFKKFKIFCNLYVLETNKNYVVRSDPMQTFISNFCYIWNIHNPIVSIIKFQIQKALNLLILCSVSLLGKHLRAAPFCYKIMLRYIVFLFNIISLEHRGLYCLSMQ